MSENYTKSKESTIQNQGNSYNNVVEYIIILVQFFLWLNGEERKTSWCISLSKNQALVCVIIIQVHYLKLPQQKLIT